MIGYAEGIATKGLLGNAVSIATKGYLIKITIEETPIIPSDGGGSGRGRIVGWGDIPRKLVKVTVEINDEIFAETKEMNADVVITTDDVNIEFNNNKPTVRVKHIGLLNKV
jgi:hypothetical protein